MCSSNEHCYDRILDFFHSPAVNVQRLSNLWVKAVLRIFPDILTVNGRLLIVGDGIKIPKSGKKMPGVKLLHQESESNTKPRDIMGHSCQAVALLVGALKSVFAVPLASRIHEGVIFSNRVTLGPLFLKVQGKRPSYVDHFSCHPAVHDKIGPGEEGRGMLIPNVTTSISNRLGEINRSYQFFAIYLATLAQNIVP